MRRAAALASLLALAADVASADEAVPYRPVVWKEQGDFLGSHTVLETLQFMNADARVARDMGVYFALVRYGDPFDYAGSDLLGAWYQRNIRIYRNIVALIDSPNERILVIYGSGHLGWLRQDIADDPTVRLRKLGDLTERP